MSNEIREAAFDDWWGRNHPWDWFAKERGGEPMDHRDRLLVWSLCRRAYLREERLDV